MMSNKGSSMPAGNMPKPMQVLAHTNNAPLHAGCFCLCALAWSTVVERLRTWLIEVNFQIPPIFVEEDELQERRRRTGLLTRGTLGPRASVQQCSSTSIEAAEWILTPGMDSTVPIDRTGPLL